MNIYYESTPSWGMDYKCTWGWPIWFQIFRHQIMSVHPADALEIPHFPGTFTQTQGLFFLSFQHRTCTWTEGLFFSGFPDTTSSRCSDFFWDIFLHFPWTFTQTMAFFFFLGFLHTISCRCSRFFWDIDPDTRVAFFRFLYMLQMLWKFRIFMGHLPQHRGCFFRVFWTLHHADAPDCPGTFTQTPGLFFLGFPHIPRTCTPFLHGCDTLFRILPMKLFVYIMQMLRCRHYLCTSCRCSRFSWDI